MASTSETAQALNGKVADIDPGSGVRLRCFGDWTLSGIDGLDRRLSRLSQPEHDAIVLDGSEIAAFDTTGAQMLMRFKERLERQGKSVRIENLREENQALLTLLVERLERAGKRATPPQAPGPLTALGKLAWCHVEQGVGVLAFLGEACMGLMRAVLQPTRIRWKALFANVESAGINALPIVGLLCFLMGVVIAYQGGLQLKTYGANIFIVELVTLTMVRELAPLMTAIIVAGRTGSAFTAQIGTMQVTEEVDAMRTIGIRPMDLLVLPKLLALIIALPLLAVFGDAVGVLGGMVMSYFLLDVSFNDFFTRIPQVAYVTSSFAIGIGKVPAFAAIIALVGCYQGFQVRGGADSVGRQTTVSVVQSIFLVIVADAAFSVLFGTLGI